MPNVVKVGLDPKRQLQVRKYLDPSTHVLSISVIQYWRVVFDAKQSDATACFAATDGRNTVPDVGQFYAPNPIAAVTEVLPQLDPESAGKAYHVQVTYSNLTPTNNNAGKWDVAVSFDGVPITESYYFDLDQYPVVNSAQQNFSQQPFRTYYDTAVVVTFKSTSFDETSAEGLRGFLNNADVTLRIAALNYQRTFPAGTLRLDNFRAIPNTQAGTLAYWAVELHLTYRPLVLAPPNCTRPNPSIGTAGPAVSGAISTLEFDVIEDLGYAYWDNGSPKKLHPFQSQQQGQTVPLNSQAPLDGTGQNSGLPEGTPNATVAFLAFRKAKRGDFSVLFAGIA